MRDITRYEILMNPGHNRVYFENARNIAELELNALSKMMGEKISGISIETIADIDYLAFDSFGKLDFASTDVISRLSSFFALFELTADGLMRPVRVKDFRHFPESLNTILKYTGKTNEQFTRLMVNLALACTKSRSGVRPKLLDPLAGKGTTLFEGIISGFDVTGVEHNPKWCREAFAFFTEFLKRGRYKHKAQEGSRSGSSGKKTADIFSVEFAKTREEYRENIVQKLDIIRTDTIELDTILKSNSFDMLVADMPYGIQHKGSTAGGASRNAAYLLKEAVPAWKNVLRPGASLVISFNEFTTKKSLLTDTFRENGFIIRDDYLHGFSHRVDQAIIRDLLVVNKP